MTIVTEKFIRKPLYVDAVRVTEENFLEIAFWCQGTIKDNTDESDGPRTTIDPKNQHIAVQVHNPNPKYPRQSRAMVGDWILHTDRGYKVYTNKAFRSSFDAVAGEQMEMPENVDKSAGLKEPGLHSAATEAGYPTDPAEEAAQ